MTIFSQEQPLYISEKNFFMTPFFTLFELSRASDDATSQNIGGTDAWAVPHLKFGGDRPQKSPLGLRPCLHPKLKTLYCLANPILIHPLPLLPSSSQFQTSPPAASIRFEIWGVVNPVQEIFDSNRKKL